MTTYTNFVPNPQGPFQFQAVLDGTPHTIIVTWLVFGQRWYVNCYDQTNTLVFSLPLIGSADGIALSDMSWSNGIATATTAVPHGLPVGQVSNLTLSGFVPDALNGDFACASLNATQFSFPLASDPGNITTLGAVSYDINMAAGYFQTSKLVFRASTQTFEVSP